MELIVEGYISKHSGYRKLLTYLKAEVIYDGTVSFIRRFLRKYDRTVDQMVQTARSEKQNIAEASMASGTFRESDIKLTNVARTSLEELMIGYEGYLRCNGYEKRNRSHRLSLRFSKLNRTPVATSEIYRKTLGHADLWICASSMICLIYIKTYLLRRQLLALESQLLKEGDLRERMSKARINVRGKNK